MDSLFNTVANFNNYHFPNWRNTEDVYYTNAIAGECGELCNMVKKLYGGGTNNTNMPTKQDLLNECADIFIYLSLFLMKNDVFGSKFEEIIVDKIDKNFERMKLNE